MALQELARNLPQIGSLVVAPELLTPLLAKLGAGSTTNGLP